MLRELQRLHSDLLAGIARLEALALDPRPDLETLTRIRTDLIRTSVARYEYVESIVFPALTDERLGPPSARLRKLRTATSALRAASTGHIGRWVADTIADDWRGYQLASSALRRSVRASVAEEMAVLYPLLERLEALER